jgi:hypothetical protein
MDADSIAPAGPEPLKHPHSHYWKTTKKGRIIENWVLSKDSDGKAVHMVDLVHPKTGERRRKTIRKVPALVRIASGGARVEGRKAKDRDNAEEDGEREGEEKKKKKCVVM